MVDVPFCLAYFHTASGKYNVGLSTRPTLQSRRGALGAAIQGRRSLAAKIRLLIATTY
jgi:hypothetical protein